jgi:hypothetical protein
MSRHNQARPSGDNDAPHGRLGGERCRQTATTVMRKRLRRGQVLAFFSRIPGCVVGLEGDLIRGGHYGQETATLGTRSRC